MLLQFGTKQMKYYNDEWQINQYAKESFERYFEQGLPPGSFCTAVLANDLISAANKADHWNQTLLASTAQWVYHNAPRGSWGSYEAVQGWLDKNQYYQEHQKQLTFTILQDSA